ncbi:VOC family protein [bacterium]|nr:VOC family protein [bacterium]
MIHGVCHVDFNAKDGKLAEFYSSIFGWSLTPFGENYTMWQNGEQQLGGGFSQPQEGQPFQPGTTVYIAVEDIDASLAKINAAGGTTIVPKTEIGGGHGFIAIFLDPDGNTTGLWSQG